MSKKTGVGACGRMSRGSAFFTRSNFTILFFPSNWIFSMSPKPIAKRRRMPLSSPTTKNAHAQLNGSTRPKGSGSSSPTTGAKKSSCTNRTWKRRDSAVYERYVLIWDPKRLEVTLLFWIIYRAKRWNSTWTRPKGSGRKPSMWLGQKERTC